MINVTKKIQDKLKKIDQQSYDGLVFVKKTGWKKCRFHKNKPSKIQKSLFRLNP